MFRKVAVGLALVPVLLSSAFAAESAGRSEVESLRGKGYSVLTVAPIFSQLVMFSFPKGFRLVFEDTRGSLYIQESVLEGQTVHKWSEMITVTGARGLVSNPNVTPQILVASIASGFKKACPDTYSAVSLGDSKISGYPAFTAVMSCGTAPTTDAPRSESALIIAIRGKDDYYTIQWAERGMASRTPIMLDSAVWADRIKKLSPIKLCPIVPGEPRPYPSCVNQKVIAK